MPHLDVCLCVSATCVQTMCGSGLLVIPNNFKTPIKKN